MSDLVPYTEIPYYQDLTPGLYLVIVRSLYEAYAIKSAILTRWHNVIIVEGGHGLRFHLSNGVTMEIVTPIEVLHKVQGIEIKGFFVSNSITHLKQEVIDVLYARIR